MKQGKNYILYKGEINVIKYKIVWEREIDGKKGSFTVTGFSDDECIKLGHDEVEYFGCEVIEYYQI